MRSRSRLVRAVFGLVTAAASVACAPQMGTGDGDAGSDAADSAQPIDVGTVTYAQVQAVYTRSCAAFSSCHNATGMRGDLDLTGESSFGETVCTPSTHAIGLNLIEPGDPARSYLVHKLEGTMRTLPECMGGNPLRCGEAMPMVSGGMLAPAELALFRAWISQGAPGPAGSSGAGDAGAIDAGAPDAR